MKLVNMLMLMKNKITSVADNLFGPGKATFRKGRVDSWRTEMPDDIQAVATKELQSVLTLWNYSE